MLSYFYLLFLIIIIIIILRGKKKDKKNCIVHALPLISIFFFVEKMFFKFICDKIVIVILVKQKAVKRTS